MYRPHITIDGLKTCEVDYSGVAIYIMYAEKNIQFPHDRDPYDIGLENWAGENDPRRKIIKRFLNAKINDETGKFRLSRDEQTKLGITHDDLMALVLDYHEPIKDKLQSGSGLETQFIDSQVAEKVMKEMMKRNQVVLPIHDSFIVRLGYEAELREVMLDAFKSITKIHGQLKADYPRLSEHFGLSVEQMTQLEGKRDQNPGYLITGVDDVIDEILDGSKSVMNSYVCSWNKWNSG